MILHELVHRGQSLSSDSVALVHEGNRLTYADLDQQSNAVAAAFLDAGLSRHDRVCLSLPKSIDLVVSLLAASKARAASVPLNPLLLPRQIVHVLSDCSPAVLVTTKHQYEQLSPHLSSVPSLRAVFITDDASGLTSESISIQSFDQARRAAAEEPRATALGADLAAILYTSGSSGRPKGVMLSHSNLVAGARIVTRYLGISASDRILAVLPFGFDYGLNQLLSGFFAGARVVLLNFRFPNEIVDALVKEEITGLAGVPPLWSVLTDPLSPIYRQSLPSMRYITNSGGAVSGKLLSALQKAFPSVEIFLMYGLTEAFRSTFLPPSELHERPSTIGKAIPETEIYVLREDGEPCAPGEPGELVHRGPTVSLGYWNNPGATSEVIRQNPRALPEISTPELVCYSGDIVVADEEGYLTFIGRRDATIKSSGYRISPTEVEEILTSIDGVSQAAAVGVEDELLGQSIHVFVVPVSGTTVDCDGLLASCADEMPYYMIPRRINVVDALPTTSTGKVDYPGLRSRAAEMENEGEARQSAP